MSVQFEGFLAPAGVSTRRIQRRCRMPPNPTTGACEIPGFPIRYPYKGRDDKIYYCCRKNQPFRFRKPPIAARMKRGELKEGDIIKDVAGHDLRVTRKEDGSGGYYLRRLPWTVKGQQREADRSAYKRLWYAKYRPPRKRKGIEELELEPSRKR